MPAGDQAGIGGVGGTFGFPPPHFSLYTVRHKGASLYESYYTSPHNGNNLTVSAIVANRLYAVPFVVSVPIDIDAIAAHVSTAAAGKLWRLGIYKDNGNCYPGALAGDSGPQSVAATGYFSYPLTAHLDPSLYFLVVISDGTPSMNIFGGYCMLNVLGYNLSNLTPFTYLYHAQAFGPLPALFPAASPTLVQSNGGPFIAVRLT